MTSAKSTPANPDTADSESSSDAGPRHQRLDRWLWAARFFKTRSLAKAAVEGGRVHLNDQRTKPAKEVHPGQVLTITRGETAQTVVIDALCEQRGPAKFAQTLYTETPESIETRQTKAAMRRMHKAGLTVPKSKPNKRDRRELRKLAEKDID